MRRRLIVRIDLAVEANDNETTCGPLSEALQKWAASRDVVMGSWESGEKHVITTRTGQDVALIALWATERVPDDPANAVAKALAEMARAHAPDEGDS